MAKLIKKTLLLILLLEICVVSMTSCDNSGMTNIRYVAAKLVDSDMWSIVDVKNGEIIHLDEFKSQPSAIVNGRFCVKNESGLYDYFSVDNVKKPINSESYLHATAFTENGVALAVLKGKGISIIDRKCETVANLDNSIVSAYGFENGYAKVSDDNDRLGYINEKGEIVIKPKYDRAYNFSSDGVAIVGKEINDSTTKYFAIDTNGKQLFSFSTNEYADFGVFNNGYLPVQKKNGDVILIDKTGKKNHSIGKWKGFVPYWLGYNDGVIVFMDGDAYGLKNEKGEIVIRAKYDALIPMAEINSKHYLAKKQDKFGIVDKDDNVIIPFDYTVLCYINKNTLIVGESKTFSFMNEDLKDIGHNNYTNLSFLTGAPVYSNYFNAQKEAHKIISNITDSTFFNTRKGMVLRDFEDKLSGYKYADMDKTTLTDYDYPYSFVYGFDRNLSSQRYEYIFGYRFPSGAEYNYGANLTAAFAITSKFERFQPGSEEALAKAFDSQIKKAGFKPVNKYSHWFKNDKDMAVALSYNEGTVTIMCAYSPRTMQLDVKRNPRENSSNDNGPIDYVDTFGLEGLDDDIVIADSAAAIGDY